MSLASYHTHLPILFRVVRQYPAANMHELEESLHIVFQHRRVKGESEDQIMAKHAGQITRNTIRMIRRSLRNQLF